MHQAPYPPVRKKSVTEYLEAGIAFLALLEERTPKTLFDLLEFCFRRSDEGVKKRLGPTEGTAA